MAQYYMSLDGGNGGTDACEASSIEEALVIAQEWAAEGDWSIAQENTENTYGGCGDPVCIRVWREDDEGTILEEEFSEYIIPTLGDLQEQELNEDGIMLATNTHEYSTEKLIRIEDDYYLVHENGGDRGAWDRRCGDGQWRDFPVEPTKLITLQEARSVLLNWGHDLKEVIKLTK